MSTACQHVPYHGSYMRIPGITLAHWATTTLFTIVLIAAIGFRVYEMHTQAPRTIDAPEPLVNTPQLPQENAPEVPVPAQNPQAPPPEEKPNPSSVVNINMAYINESPDGSWKGSWKNGCEEAAIAMVDYYYQGVKSVSISDAMVYMQHLFDAQKTKWGSDANSDAARNLFLIETETAFDARIVDNPTLEQIKAEVDAGRPVITHHHGFDLKNKNIPFLATGSSYHVVVVKGYDEFNKQFIVHDTGDSKEGEDHRYDYTIFMNSLHDYQFSTQKADGVPRVLFTSPRAM